MRPIYITHAMTKARPVVLLTREPALGFLRHVVVAPITTTVKELETEVPVGPQNGLKAESVISCDNIMLIETEELGNWVGQLSGNQDRALTKAIAAAFDLATDF